MVGNESTGPRLYLVEAQFSNFLLRKLSCDFKLHRMLIAEISNGHIPIMCEATVTWSGTFVW